MAAPVFRLCRTNAVSCLCVLCRDGMKRTPLLRHRHVSITLVWNVSDRLRFLHVPFGHGNVCLCHTETADDPLQSTQRCYGNMPMLRSTTKHAAGEDTGRTCGYTMDYRFFSEEDVWNFGHVLTYIMEK